jgi:undecaprenol kinase
MQPAHGVGRSLPTLIFPNMKKNQPFYKRLGFAVHGVRAAWRNEASFCTQSCAAFIVLLVLIWRQPAPLWWAVLLVNCGMVLAAELFNSALEAALDLLHPEMHPSIKLAKDCAAGGVLMLSVTAVGVFVAFVIATFPVHQ